MKTTLRLLVSTLVLLSLLATLRAQAVSRVATFGSTESPESIAVDAAGNCYLSLSTGEIRRVTPAGVASLFAMIPEPGAPKAPGVKFDADGLIIDPVTGNFIVSVNIQNKIAVVTPQGEISTLVAGGPLAIPTSTAPGRAGAERTLYICNNGVLFPGANAACPSPFSARWSSKVISPAGASGNCGVSLMGQAGTLIAQNAAFNAQIGRFAPGSAKTAWSAGGIVGQFRFLRSKNLRRAVGCSSDRSAAPRIAGHRAAAHSADRGASRGRSVRRPCAGVPRIRQ